MKHVLSLLVLTLVLACNNTPKDYVQISGKLDEKGDISSFKILNQEQGYDKDITLNDDGSFSDTLKVKDGKYILKIGRDFAFLYLKNDTETAFSANASNLYETLKFTGYGAEKSNFNVENIKIHRAHLTPDIMTKSNEAFKATLNQLSSNYDALKTKFSAIDNSFFESSDKEFEQLKASLEKIYAQKNASIGNLTPGTVSPIFKDYENYKGGTTSLTDLKGKYVYIDVWATWCAPCKAEIPALKRLEKAYHGKNIAFVSLSIDDAKYSGSMENARKKWKRLIEAKTLKGIQLLAPNGWQSQFVRDYNITGIPRFILIDPEGKVVNANAPRPSNPEIKTLLDTLIAS